MSRLRVADLDDMAAVARLHRKVRLACLPYLPDLHMPAEDLWFFREIVFPGCTVWIAEAETVLGFCAFRTGWVDHLYVDPAHHGTGIGSALIGRAMAAEPALRLWVFQRNTAAIRFYRARGFTLERETDGARNDEREPDALYAWNRQKALQTRP